MECPAYAHERKKLGQKKGELEMKYAEIVSSEKRIIALALYLQATRRFTEDIQELENKRAAYRTKKCDN